MKQEQFWQEFSSLPPTAQTLVSDFIHFLQEKYQAGVDKTDSEQMLLIRNEPFVGMWNDHTQLTDSTDFVRSLRATEWGTARE